MHIGREQPVCYISVYHKLWLVFQRNSWHCDGIYDNAGLAVLHETHAVHVLEYA